MAIESGYALATILARWNTSPDASVPNINCSITTSSSSTNVVARPLDEALSFYQNFRKPRTDKITETSVIAGKIASSDLPEEEWAKAFDPAQLRDRMRWIMEYDIVGDLEAKAGNRLC